MFQKIKHKIFSWLGLIDRPVIKVYNGFGNADTVLIMGHVLRLSPAPRQTFRGGWLANFFAVLRLFMVRPLAHAVVAVDWGGELFETAAQSDGFFRFEFKPKLTYEPGWYGIEVFLKNDHDVRGNGSVYLPHPTQVGFISDIDDTFLVSHTKEIRKRLFELLAHNERNRRAFDGVINHYQQLARGSAYEPGIENPFFYVSSSEWNLYPFLIGFIGFNKLPKGVLLLGQMKRLKDFWKSGQNHHATKFMRISRIMNAYPSQKFVLLGDDSQKDPEIYHAIVKHFADRILAVYIRRVYQRNFVVVSAMIAEIQARGVDCCYFEHSSEAVIHSRKLGLIT